KIGCTGKPRWNREIPRWPAYWMSSSAFFWTWRTARSRLLPCSSKESASAWKRREFFSRFVWSARNCRNAGSRGIHPPRRTVPGKTKGTKYEQGYGHRRFGYEAHQGLDFRNRFAGDA